MLETSAEKQLASIDEHIQGKQSIDELIKQNQGVTSMVATIRSREISACLFLQAKSQLKAIYKDNTDTIIGNMDSHLVLGGTEPTTLKDLSQFLGKENHRHV